MEKTPITDDLGWVVDAGIADPRIPVEFFATPDGATFTAKVVKRDASITMKREAYEAANLGTGLGQSRFVRLQDGPAVEEYLITRSEYAAGDSVRVWLEIVRGRYDFTSPSEAPVR